VEATHICYTSPLLFPLDATLVRLLFDLAAVFMLQNISRVELLDQLSF
jgi:hypothetical protein